MKFHNKKNKKKIAKVFIVAVFSLLLICIGILILVPPVSAVGATTYVHIYAYSSDGSTLLDEEIVSYQYMKNYLPVYGNGTLHYYHQGPTFESDNKWDENETINLKDKGAVMGTHIKDLCDLVGGMVDGFEVLMHAVDNWTIKFMYNNVYEAEDRQGIISLCWYNGEDALVGEKYGEGYPSNYGYYTALQIVIMANTTNENGQYVFGNEDMNKTMPPEEGYSHFYHDAEGFWPSTNGLSGKWIDAMYIYNTSSPPDLNLTANNPGGSDTTTPSVPWLPITLGLGIGGAIMIGLAIFFVIRKRKE